MLTGQLQVTLRYSNHRSQVPRGGHPDPPQDIPSPTRDHHLAPPDTRQSHHSLASIVQTSILCRFWDAHSVRDTSPRCGNVASISMAGSILFRTGVSAADRSGESRESDHHRIDCNVGLQAPSVPHRHPTTTSLLLGNRRHVCGINYSTADRSCASDTRFVIET